LTSLGTEACRLGPLSRRQHFFLPRSEGALAPSSFPRHYSTNTRPQHKMEFLFLVRLTVVQVSSLVYFLLLPDFNFGFRLLDSPTRSGQDFAGLAFCCRADLPPLSSPPLARSHMTFLENSAHFRIRRRWPFGH